MSPSFADCRYLRTSQRSVSRFRRMGATAARTRSYMVISSNVIHLAQNLTVWVTAVQRSAGGRKETVTGTCRAQETP
jgi:hypothetical protein